MPSACPASEPAEPTGCSVAGQALGVELRSSKVDITRGGGPQSQFLSRRGVGVDAIGLRRRAPSEALVRPDQQSAGPWVARLRERLASR